MLLQSNESAVAAVADVVILNCKTGCVFFYFYIIIQICVCCKVQLLHEKILKFKIYFLVKWEKWNIYKHFTLQTLNLQVRSAFFWSWIFFSVFHCLFFENCLYFSILSYKALKHVPLIHDYLIVNKITFQSLCKNQDSKA